MRKSWKMKICKYCDSEHDRDSDYCSINCYQLWRYHNIPEVKKKHIKRTSKRFSERYKADGNFRRKVMANTRKWQKKNVEKVREIARKSRKKIYWENKKK